MQFSETFILSIPSFVRRVNFLLACDLPPVPCIQYSSCYASSPLAEPFLVPPLLLQLLAAQVLHELRKV